MRLVVTGQHGQVARALIALGPQFGAHVIALARPEIDLADERDLLEPFRRAQPDVIVSAAAYTAVDRAESEPDIAQSINARAPERIAAAAAVLNVPLIHLSTDYVFDGKKTSPWVEADAPGPLSVYGATKLAGERAVLTTASDCTVLRVAWVYSPFGNNFVKTMVRLAGTNDAVRVVADQHGAPTSAHEIAAGIFKVAANLLGAPGRAELRGVFHMGAAGETTWAGFADAIFDGIAAGGGRRVAVIPITTADYPAPARRPRNSVLNSAKLADVHGVALTAWRGALEPVLEAIVASSLPSKSRSR